jgi:hypothetical protein
MNAIHRNCRTEPRLAVASLAEIESEIADVLDVMEAVQSAPDLSHANAVWQIAEAVKGLAWAVGSLAQHDEDLAVTTAAGGLARL